MPSNSKKYSVPNAMQYQYQEICSIIDEFCSEKLNEDYSSLSKELAAKLARKRPSPLNSGRLYTWACGIVYVIGSVNFLFDKSQSPHIKAAELCAWFGVTTSTGSNKANQIKKMMHINQFSNEWILPDLVDKHPMAWMISVDGFIVDARLLPTYLQEEAFRKGLIPYIPDNSAVESND
ncbi:MAG: hypothetical protein CVU41_18835 [Chloroflexi bacterium HGW-Chloroflexi-3]|nr:MAG: hypothetical protein CVU41_18835 [Chloroflexi bacterium HGW-Chloroflexi-3]